MDAAALIREARLRGKLTQAELATRAGTTQSAIARWETGQSSPSADKVAELVGHCGFDLELSLSARDPELISQLEANLRLTPTQRLDQLVRAVRFISAGRRALDNVR